MITFIVTTSMASAQEKGVWHNPGDGTQPQFNPELGEFHHDIGGFVEFPRYDAPGHPYDRAMIEKYFFDPDGLDAYLNGTLSDPQIVEVDEGTYKVWYLGSSVDVSYKSVEINGATLRIVWNPQALVSQPDVLLELKSSRGPHSGPSPFVDLGDGRHVPDHGLEIPPNHFTGMPLAPPEKAVESGHYLAILTPNRWPDFWLATQRSLDTIRYLDSHPLFDIDQVFIHGGSWEGAQAMKALLFAPKHIHGAISPFFLDFAFEAAQGGWEKLLMSFFTALGADAELTPVPARGHSIEAFTFGFPTLRAAGLDSGWEWGAFSLLQRRALQVADRLQRPIHWYIGNCDIYHNVHFYLDPIQNDTTLKDYTGKIGSLQFLGHGGEGAGPQNHQFFYDGTELADIEVDPKASTSINIPVNPAINPGAASAPSDIFYREAYRHTLLDVPDSSDYVSSRVTSSFLTEANWQPNLEPSTLGPYGNGILPGAYDSFRVGDFDGDNQVEVIFGNFDGFVEVLEETATDPAAGPSQPILVPEYRSPPLGWNVQALDVGTIEGETAILCGSAVGQIYKIVITPSFQGGVYSTPVPFIQQSQERPQEGFLQWLYIADFHHNLAGNEVLIQDELSQWYLYSEDGIFLAKSKRGATGSTSDDNYSVSCGKPWVGYWPPYAPTDAVEAFLPGIDGRLRRLYYNGTDLIIQVVSDDFVGMGRCAMFWDPPSACGPYIIVGALHGKGDAADSTDDGHPITVIDPAAGPGNSIVAQFTGSIHNPVTIEPYAPNEFIIAHGDKLDRLQFSVDMQCNVTIEAAIGNPATVTLPGVRPGGAPSREAELFGSAPEVCGAELYTSSLPGQPQRYVVPTPAGRFWLVDHADFSIPRTTETLELPALGSPKPWYSNRSFGRTLLTDQRHHPGENDDQDIWIADGVYRYTSIGAIDRQRFAGVSPGTGGVDDWMDNPQNNTSGETFGLTINQDNGNAIFFFENGALSGTTRYTMLGPAVPFGGYIQENDSSPTILQNFDVPIDPTHEEFSSGGSSSGWPFHESPRYRGEVSTHVVPGQRPWGNTVLMGLLEPVPTNPEEAHVVVGTLGGFVYAVAPDAEDGLSYSTPDLGWCVVGLDIGDVDGDAKNEVVAGTWVDTAHVDEIGIIGKHRGHLYILDPGPNNEFLVTEIELTIPDRFGAGVWGVKIDDINGDGTNEVWVTDARGYLHALWKSPSGDWECVFRTKGLGMYAGMYNKIWPFKESGQTTWLAVQTPGYIYRFQVNPNDLPEN